jgi:hypothetical protein
MDQIIADADRFGFVLGMPEVKIGFFDGSHGFLWIPLLMNFRVTGSIPIISAHRLATLS